MEKKYKYIIGIDPSGAYKEGSGTTGWCVLDTHNNILEVGTIAAKEFPSFQAYWKAHATLIRELSKRYGFSLAVSMEDYILYKNHAMAQVNSQLETPQLIGYIKMYCFDYAIDVYIRPAVAVKTRWADEILTHKGILRKEGKRFTVGCKGDALCDHERDAIRHAVHFNTFENKEE